MELQKNALLRLRCDSHFTTLDSGALSTALIIPSLKQTLLGAEEFAGIWKDGSVGKKLTKQTRGSDSGFPAIT